MKIAIPTRENKVDSHFGHCESYSIFTIENQQIKNIESIASPQGCGCKSNIASVLQQMGVTIMLAGNMGDGALFVLNNHGIEVYRGNSGNINDVVTDFIDGKIQDSGTGCNHHDEGHQCNH